MHNGMDADLPSVVAAPAELADTELHAVVIVSRSAAMMQAVVHSAPPEVGHTSRRPSRAINHAPINYGIEWPLPRRRTSALRNIDGLQRVDSCHWHRAAVGRGRVETQLLVDLWRGWFAL